MSDFSDTAIPSLALLSNKVTFDESRVTIAGSPLQDGR